MAGKISLWHNFADDGMITVEKKKAETPASTELESNVSGTLIPTFPQRTVVNKKFESFRIFKILTASRFPRSASTSSLSRLILKRARFIPENMADWETQKIIPIQVSKLIRNSVSITKFLARVISSFKTYECPIVSLFSIYQTDFSRSAITCMTAS